MAKAIESRYISNFVSIPNAFANALDGASGTVPKVSVVINNHNYGRFLRNAIDSVLTQQCVSFGRESVEIIVVDDGSTDCSHDVIKSYGSQIIPVLKVNGGQDSAFNAGFAKCTGDIVCLLDADDRFVPGKLEKIVSCFRQQPNIGWCFHSLRLEDVHSARTICTTRAFPRRHGLKDRWRQRDDAQYCDFRESLQVGSLPFYPPSTSGLCFRRSVLACILPMPETFINTSADRYVRVAAMALSPGYFLADELTVQGIHGNNVSTLRCDRPSIPERQIVVAYLLRTQFPSLARYANRLFSRGLTAYESVEPGTLAPEYAVFIRAYWRLCSPMEHAIIALLRFYRKRPWRQLEPAEGDYYHFAQPHSRTMAQRVRATVAR